jgi:hypothetical protein
MTTAAATLESVEAILAAAGVNALRADSSAGDQEVALRALGDRAASLDAVRSALLRERAIQALKTAGLEGPVRLVDSAIGAGRQDRGSAGAGSPVLFAAIEPWASIVIGAELLDEIESVVRRYVVLPAEAAVVAALSGSCTPTRSRQPRSRHGWRSSRRPSGAGEARCSSSLARSCGGRWPRPI